MIFKNTLKKNIHFYKNFSYILDEVAKKYPENIYITDDYRSYTFEEFNILVNKCCNLFYEMKLKKKDVISIYLNNSIEFVILYFASIRYGTIINPLPISISTEDIIKKTQFVKTKILFTFTRIPHLKKNYFLIEKNNFLKLLNKKSDKFNYKQKKFTSDIAAYYYSSGTSAEPKIIVYSNQSIVATQFTMVKSKFLKTFSNHLCFLPMAHTSALRYSIKYCVSSVSTVFIKKNYWNIRKDFWRIIKENKINFFQSVPSILQLILESRKVLQKQTSKQFQFIGCGSSYLSHNLKLEFEKKFNIKVANLYGLSELGATHFEKKKILSSEQNIIGKPFKHVEAKIIKNKQELPPNNIGEIAIKTPGLFIGYLKNKKLSKKKFYKNFFLTGDLGFKNKKGDFFYTDRKKNIIIKGGVNIEPEEINNILKKNKNVLDVATFGIFDKIFGEEIISVIVSKNKLISCEKLKEKCRDELGVIKTPKDIVCIKELPKTSSGKVLVRKIKDLYINEYE